MKVYVGADHRGFKLKEVVKGWLSENDFEVEDVGAFVHDPDDDYVDYAAKVVRGVVSDGAVGVLFCGSGHGMDVVANRYRKIRSIIGFNRDVVVQGREHENANVLCVPSDWVSEKEVIEFVDVFLKTEFSGEDRHKRRLQKLSVLGG